MNTTVKLFGTTYTTGNVDNEITLTGPRGGFYILTPVFGYDNVFTLNSIFSGEKRIQGNRAFVALINGEIIEAGKHGRIELPEVEVAEETTEDAEMTEFNAEVAALIENEARPTIESTMRTVVDMIRDGVQAGDDYDTAYSNAISAMFALDGDAMKRLYVHMTQGQA